MQIPRESESWTTQRLIATPGKVLDLNPKSEGGSTEGVCLPLESPGEPIEEVVATPQVRRTGLANQGGEKRPKTNE